MMDREKALQIIWDRCQHSKETEKALEGLKEERPHGEWEYTGCVNDELQAEFCCSICNYSTYSRQYNFCPNCGADMREGDMDG